MVLKSPLLSFFGLFGRSNKIQSLNHSNTEGYGVGGGFLHFPKNQKNSKGQENQKTSKSRKCTFKRKTSKNSVTTYKEGYLLTPPKKTSTFSLFTLKMDSVLFVCTDNLLPLPASNNKAFNSRVTQELKKQVGEGVIFL